MPVFKNESNNTWYVMARYVNWKGERKQKCKRGFPTKREAQDWERSFQMQTAADMEDGKILSFDAEMQDTEAGIDPDIKENITTEDYRRGIDTIIETAIKAANTK